MMAELTALFALHQREGRVIMTYDTKIYFGALED